MSAPERSVLAPLPSEPPFVGRARELEALGAALREAKASTGSAWLIEGAAGMGKTRLIRQLQGAATAEGFETLWAYGMREISTPFLFFEQLFRGQKRGAAERGEPLPRPLPSFLVLEEEKPRRLFSEAASLSSEHACLLISREKSGRLREQYPSLSPQATTRWLSRGESEEALAPGNLDSLGETTTRFFQEHAGGLVALAGFEYLVAVNGFSSVLRFLQFLRDSAEEHGGTLLISLSPATLEPRELALVEGEGTVVGAAKRGESGTRAPQSPSEVMMHYLDLLEERSSSGPSLFVLDDLQWADADSLRAFQFFVRNVRRLPVVIVATRRTEDPIAGDETHHRLLTEILENVTREGSVRRIALRGISAAEGASLAQGMLGKPITGGAEDASYQDLFERSGGNPFFLKEIMAQLSERGYLRHETGSIQLPTPSESRSRDSSGRPLIPNSLRHLLSRNLEPLSESMREVLECAAVIGLEFDPSPILGLLPDRAPDLDMVLRGLASEHRLLEQRRGLGGENWAFAYPLLWEVVRDEIPRGTYRRRALALAQWWAVHRTEEVATLARLYHDSALGEEGIPWVRKALDRALVARVPESVERFHAWLQDLHAESNAGTATRVSDSLEVVERMQEQMGSSGEVVRILRTALALDPGEDLRRLCDAWLALALVLSDPQGAQALMTRLRRELKGRPLSAKLESVLSLAEASAALGLGQAAPLTQAVERILGLDTSIPVWIRVRALYYSGVSFSRQGNAVEARARLDEAFRLAEPTRNPWLLGACSDLEAFLAGLRGDVGAMARATEKTLEHVRVIGDVNVITREALFNLGLDHVLEGDLPGARANLAECRKLSERFRLPWGAYLVPDLEGEIALREGRWSEAADLLRRSRGAMEKQGDTELRASVTLAIAEAHLGAGDPVEARRELELLRAGKDQEISEDLWILYHLEEGWCRELSGDPAAAKRSYEEGLRQATASGNLFAEGLALRYVARWEQTHGEAARDKELLALARARLDQAGVRSTGWARSWPPPLSDPVG